MEKRNLCKYDDSFMTASGVAAMEIKNIHCHASWPDLTWEEKICFLWGSKIPPERCFMSDGSVAAWAAFLKMWLVGPTPFRHPSLCLSVVSSSPHCLTIPPHPLLNQFLNPISHCIRLWGKTPPCTAAWQMFGCCYCLFELWELLIREYEDIKENGGEEQWR